MTENVTSEATTHSSFLFNNFHLFSKNQFLHPHSTASYAKQLHLNHSPMQPFYHSIDFLRLCLFLGRLEQPSSIQCLQHSAPLPYPSVFGSIVHTFVATLHYAFSAYRVTTFHFIFANTPQTTLSPELQALPTNLFVMALISDPGIID